MEYICGVAGFTSTNILDLCAYEARASTSKQKFVEIAGHIFVCGDCSRVYRTYRQIFDGVEGPDERDVSETINRIFRGDPDV